MAKTLYINYGGRMAWDAKSVILPLGVKQFTDKIAGFAFGLLIFSVAWLLPRLIHKR